MQTNGQKHVPPPLSEVKIQHIKAAAASNVVRFFYCVRRQSNRGEDRGCALHCCCCWFRTVSRWAYRVTLPAEWRCIAYME